MRYSIASLAFLLSLGQSGCIEFKDDDSAAKKQDAQPQAATPAADSSDVTAPSYETYALDTAGVGARYAGSPADDSLYGQITSKSVEAKATRFPMKVPRRGAAALQLQVLLDRAHFSPGIIDGTWGENAAKALAFFQSPNSTDSAAAADNTPSVDSATLLDQATYSRLRAAVGSQPILTQYTVTAEDVKGPFTTVPDNVYEQAKLECLCYASAAEAIAEKFHTSQKLLAQLNPKVELANLTAGTSLIVPNVDVQAVDSSAASAVSAGGGGIAKLIVSRKGFWTHAVDASGKVLYHFPSTVGSGYLSSSDESPSGGFRITNVSWNPAFHYQPKLFAEVSDKKPDARLPKGPNSPVGVVWMALSKPHFGIHGTSAPETIGYTNSHGCVRLTNWDATELGRLVSKGTPVEFR
jgi:lipoprotein-anchoring transpeptidase ErfK/SrfK